VGVAWIDDLNVRPESSGGSPRFRVESPSPEFLASWNLLWVGGRGFNTVTVNAAGEVLEVRSFDAWADVNELRNFVTYVGNVPTGTLLLIAVGDSISQFGGVWQDAVAVLERLGSKLIRQVGWRISWAFITKVGTGVGLAEAAGTSQWQPISVEWTLPAPPRCMN